MLCLMLLIHVYVYTYIKYNGLFNMFDRLCMINVSFLIRISERALRAVERGCRTGGALMIMVKFNITTNHNSNKTNTSNNNKTIIIVITIMYHHNQ